VFITCVHNIDPNLTYNKMGIIANKKARYLGEAPGGDKEQM